MDVSHLYVKISRFPFKSEAKGSEDVSDLSFDCVTSIGNAETA